MSVIHTITLNPVLDLIYEVEEFQKGTTFRCDDFRLIPAGKGLNVSYALASMGEETHAYAFVGWKESDLFSDACREKGIYFHPYVGNFQTRRHCTILERATGSTTHVQVKGETAPIGPIRDLINDLSEQIQPDDWVVFSGSVPPGLPVTIYAEMMKRCRRQGAKTFLDASGEPLIEGVKAAPDFLKVNQLEAEELTGLVIDGVESAAAALKAISSADKPISRIALSMGKRGLLAAAQDEMLHLWIEIDENKIRDTVGCGDAMVAGLLYGLNHEFNPEAVFRYGIACASAAALQIGPAHFEWTDMESMLREAQIQEIQGS
ncbi:MAG: 1-phosphofructokinase family hexose kinase [Candidatus Hinthialibacter sp.]